MESKYFLFFLLGFFSCALLFFILSGSFGITGFSVSHDIKSPGNWVDREDIVVLQDKIILNIYNATLSSYSDTGSMRPFLDKGSKGIRIKPQNESQIGVGDIISYRVYGYLVVHRVVYIGEDEFGIYFVARGDDNIINDDKVRFKDIEWVTVGIIY